MVNVIVQVTSITVPKCGDTPNVPESVTSTFSFPCSSFTTTDTLIHSARANIPIGHQLFTNLELCCFDSQSEETQLRVPLDHTFALASLPPIERALHGASPPILVIRELQGSSSVPVRGLCSHDNDIMHLVKSPAGSRDAMRLSSDGAAISPNLPQGEGYVEAKSFGRSIKNSAAYSSMRVESKESKGVDKRYAEEPEFRFSSPKGVQRALNDSGVTSEWEKNVGDGTRTNTSIYDAEKGELIKTSRQGGNDLGANTGLCDNSFSDEERAEIAQLDLEISDLKRLIERAREKMLVIGNESVRDYCTHVSRVKVRGRNTDCQEMFHGIGKVEDVKPTLLRIREELEKETDRLRSACWKESRESALSCLPRSIQRSERPHSRRITESSSYVTAGQRTAVSGRDLDATSTNDRINTANSVKRVQGIVETPGSRSGLKHSQRGAHRTESLTRGTHINDFIREGILNRTF